jgi:hypothetical protein
MTGKEGGDKQIRTDNLLHGRCVCVLNVQDLALLNCTELEQQTWLCGQFPCDVFVAVAK